MGILTCFIIKSTKKWLYYDRICECGYLLKRNICLKKEGSVGFDEKSGKKLKKVWSCQWS